VRQLQRNRHCWRVGARARKQLLYRLLARVVVQSEAAMRDPADGRNRCGLDREHARARLQHLSPMDAVPIRGPAIDRRVLAHRRHDDAIGKFQFAQRESREQIGRHEKVVDDVGEVVSVAIHVIARTGLARAAVTCRRR